VEYQTLYRRWRPRKFSDFVGQNHVMQTLSNAIAGDRIAHAYLFTGPRGTGKTSAAKILAKALNCENANGAEPCDQCSSCTRINDGIFMDVLEIDAASNRGIDEIRDLREKVKFASTEGKYKIYIIDEVHMLTAEAFNALLKTLEEPPQFVVFILATTEVNKIPPTILSRCQRFDFKRFTVAEIKGRLLQILEAEEVKASEPALELIAKHSEGGMRDALSLLEQTLAHRQGGIEESDVRAILGLIDQEEINLITEAIKNRDIRQALSVLNEVCMDGKDLFQFGRSLVGHFRELLLGALTDSGAVRMFSPGELIRIIETLATATNEVKRSLQSALPLELAFIKLAMADTPPDNLEARVARLEALLQGGAVARQPVTQAAPIPPQPVSVNPLPAARQPVPPESRPGTLSGSNGFEGWDAFLEEVKKKKRTLAALIQEGKPLSFDQGELVVGFPPNLKFHLENLALAQNKELLESILKGMINREVKITCIPLPDGQKTVKKSEPATAAGPDSLAQAVTLFGGEVRPVLKEDQSK
jgi:DNA polymerase III subunit gamma/tau